MYFCFLSRLRAHQAAAAKKAAEEAAERQAAEEAAEKKSIEERRLDCCSLDVLMFCSRQGRSWCPGLFPMDTDRSFVQK